MQIFQTIWALYTPPGPLSFLSQRNREVEGPKTSKKYVKNTQNVKSDLSWERVPESLWKPHKSKGLNLLLRNCVPTFCSTPKKIFFREFIFR